MVDSAIETAPGQRIGSDNRTDIRWPLPPPNWQAQLGEAEATSGSSLSVPGHVHVWASSLDLEPDTLASLAESLAPDERERAARFRFAIHQRRFTAGRGVLRRLLSIYLNTEPSSLKFVYGPNGKPALIPASRNRALDFNLAHSEDLLLIAVTRRTSIGIDIEQVRLLDDIEDLVARFFSPSECAAFQKLDPRQKLPAFFNLWTRKEAWLKATGEGITHLLNQVEVSFLSGQPARLLRLPAPYQNSLWSLYELTPKHGFVAALAVSGAGHHVDCWQHPGF
ncbi:MAG TPA: 4'-phosphopantetheinyl transferase superfamily protein [Candidatus Limnocylindrales bacterium]|jgi:4'-phosphopantetheinyl transferase|nr:4'-phosphopantetheinyl transferase superfamily protein [Candidatus Limnocylindrales bacterium]